MQKAALSACALAVIILIALPHLSQETLPECNAPLTSSNTSVTGEGGANYSTTLNFGFGDPTNTPCWKDLYVGVFDGGADGFTWVYSEHSTGLLAEDHVRVYFTAPSPSPTPTPEPTAEPTPLPSPSQNPTATPTPTPQPSPTPCLRFLPNGKCKK